jgi:hypothetical protein
MQAASSCDTAATTMFIVIQRREDERLFRGTRKLNRRWRTDPETARIVGLLGVVGIVKTGRGVFAKYGQAPSGEEIDANRADMFGNFGEDLSTVAAHSSLKRRPQDARLLFRP